MLLLVRAIRMLGAVELVTASLPEACGLITAAVGCHSIAPIKGAGADHTKLPKLVDCFHFFDGGKRLISDIFPQLADLVKVHNFLSRVALYNIKH